MKRPQKFKYNLKTFVNDLWTHIYGAITILSLLTAITFSVLTLYKQQVAFRDVLYVCLLIILVLVLVIMRVTMKYTHLHSMSTDLLNYERENEDLVGLVQLQAKTTHNIIHYYRSLIFDIDNLLQKMHNPQQEITQGEVDFINEKNDHFLIMLTTSLQNYFSISSDDNCSVCIKVSNNDEIKTLFRDPVNLKNRRQAEIDSKNQVYKASKNTAFDIIMSPKFKEFHFACDDLEERYKSHNYINANPKWNNYYNATYVVPISKVHNNNDSLERNILGFVTIDNMAGYLVDETTKELLFGVGDLLYNYVYKFKILAGYTQTKKLKNDKAELYVWN